MNRYRLVLTVVALLVATAVIFTVIRQPAAPTVATTGTTLVPAGQRVPAPDFTGIDAWINGPPLSLSGLHGKVVLVDFWTFSCVNCVRTFPHLQQLYASYRDRGLVIVGVHSPEFDFEKVVGNVAAAVQRLGVSWPVAVDSELATWNAYSNTYWPAEYLIDQQGRVAYLHFGEGDYDTTAAAVASLLGVGAPAGAGATSPPGSMTPELYAGSTRGQLADGEAYGPQGHPVSYPDPGPPQANDAIQLTGAWIDFGQYVQAAGAARLRLRFQAGDLYVVVGSAGGQLPISVQLDGAPVPVQLSGPALAGSGFLVTRQDLYQLLRSEAPGHHLIDLSVPAGFQLYTFTFG